MTVPKNAGSELKSICPSWEVIIICVLYYDLKQKSPRLQKGNNLALNVEKPKI